MTTNFSRLILSDTGAARLSVRSEGEAEEPPPEPLFDTVSAALRSHAARRSKQTYLIAPETGRRLTYGAIAREAQLLHRYLHAQGIKPGAHVALYLPNGLQTTTLFLAAMAMGYVIVPLNLVAQPSQLAYVLDHCDCAILFTAREQEAALTEALPHVARRFPVIVIDADAPSLFIALNLPPAPTGIVRVSDAALLMYTSGTTGQPKGALLTHANLCAAASSVARWHRLTPEDRVLSSLPLYHINGQVIVTLTPFLSGGSVIAPRKFSASTWWSQAEEHRATWINLVPTIIAYLLNAAAPDFKRISRIRFARSASAPLPPEHHRAFEAAFGIGVIEAMGMTECASIVFCNPQAEGARKIGSPGVPCGVEAKVVDPQDTSASALPDGVAGELLLRGPNVMPGYYKAPKKTADAITPDGWLRTGDLGFRDADGFYFITGRLKELIIKGGENIAPREIDEALLKHPAVFEAAAVGVPDSNYGQEILAAVVLREGAFDLALPEGRAAAEVALREHCLHTLGKYKTPRFFRLLSELPKGPSGKIQRMNVPVRKTQRS